MSTKYSCKVCRQHLFTEEDIMTDHQKSTHTIDMHKAIKDAKSKTRKDECTSYFLKEPLEWMKKEEEKGEKDKKKKDEDESEPPVDVEGKILCPSCKGKVGSYNWYGAQCSCGSWVTPAIQFNGSKVDAKKPLKI